MTAVEFHVNQPDKLGFACRLLRKAVARGSKVIVTGDPQTLRELDTTLWTFSATAFLPHCYGESAGPDVVAASPVVLLDSPREAATREVLVNLGPAVPDGFERFDRLIEIVSVEEADLQEGRRRWKHYANRGYAITKHDPAAREAG